MAEFLYRMQIPNEETDALTVTPSVKVPSTFIVAMNVIAGDYGVGEETKLPSHPGCHVTLSRVPCAVQ